MTVQEIIDDHDLEVDDIRWYLSLREAERLLTYRDDRKELASLIQSGRLEADWYRMEERFVEDLQEQLDRKETDEPEVRKICRAIETERRERFAE